MKKRYEVKGMIEWHPVFKVGRSSLQVSFTGGNLCGGARTCASFETSDPVVQTVIEGSEAFRSKRIRLVYTEAFRPAAEEQRPDSRSQRADSRCQSLEYGRETCFSLGGANSQPPIDSNIFEYSKEEDIYEYLQHTRGVPVEDLSAKGSCYDVAQRLGIELRKKS